MELLERIRAFLATDTEKLLTNYKNTHRGTLTVPEIRPAIEELKANLQWVTEQNLKMLPQALFAEFGQLTNDFLNIIERLSNLEKDPNQTDENQRRFYVEYFNSHPNADQYKGRIVRLWPIISYASALESKADGTPIQQAEAEAIENLRAIIAAKEQVDTLLNATKEEIAIKGVSKHAQIFANQAKNHKKTANTWGVVAGLLLIINAFTIVCLYNSISGTDVDKIQLGILSFLLISLLSYVIVQVVRSYFAERHNQAVNQHKANCLSSYNTFIETAATEEVRAIILQYVTQTIFASFNPGYLSKDLMQTPLPIIEMLKTVQVGKKID